MISYETKTKDKDDTINKITNSKDGTIILVS